MTIEFIDNRNRFFEDVKALGRKNSVFGYVRYYAYPCIRQRATKQAVAQSRVLFLAIYA